MSELRKDYQNLIDAIEKNREHDLRIYNIAALTLINKVPSRYNLTIVEAGLVFRYEEGPDENLGPYRVNLGYNDSHTFTSSDEKSVEAFLALDIQVGNEMRVVSGIIKPDPGKRYLSDRDIELVVGNIAAESSDIADMFQISWSKVGNG